MTAAPAKRSARRGQLKFVVWMVLAAVIFAGFIWLGQWQVYRYHVRLDIAHAIDTRVHAAPVPAPGPAVWPRIAAGHLQYLHVRLHGEYLPVPQTLVHGGSKDGYGFWAMAPLLTKRGFIVLVNRGYVPPNLPGTPGYRRALPPRGSVTVTGLVRKSDKGGGFLRANQPAKGLWYSRDVAAIARARGLPAEKVAPYFVDADARAAGARWPAGGLANITIYNHSMGYAITWFILAAGTLLCAGIVIRYEWRERRRSAV